MARPTLAICRETSIRNRIGSELARFFDVHLCEGDCHRPQEFSVLGDMDRVQAHSEVHQVERESFVTSGTPALMVAKVDAQMRDTRGALFSDQAQPFQGLIALLVEEQGRRFGGELCVRIEHLRGFASNLAAGAQESRALVDLGSLREEIPTCDTNGLIGHQVSINHISQFGG